MTEQPRIVDPADAPVFETPQGEDVVVLARGDEPGETYDLVEFTIPTEPGFVPLHIHHNDHEAFYVMDGEVRLQIGEESYELGPGSYAFGPRGVPHGYQNTGDGPVRMLVLYTPGSFVKMGEEIADLGSLDLDDESNLEQVLEIFAAYDLEMVGPPPDAD